MMLFMSEFGRKKGLVEGFFIVRVGFLRVEFIGLGEEEVEG